MNTWSEAPQPTHSDCLPLQIADGLDPLRADQLEAADLYPRQEDDLAPRVDLLNERPDIAHAEVHLAGSQGLPGPDAPVRVFNVVHLSKPLAGQKCFGDELGR